MVYRNTVVIKAMVATNAFKPGDVFVWEGVKYKVTPEKTWQGTYKAVSDSGWYIYVSPTGSLEKMKADADKGWKTTIHKPISGTKRLFGGGGFSRPDAEPKPNITPEEQRLLDSKGIKTKSDAVRAKATAHAKLEAAEKTVKKMERQADANLGSGSSFGRDAAASINLDRMRKGVREVDDLLRRAFGV